jgi:hypothetical protein
LKKLFILEEKKIHKKKTIIFRKFLSFEDLKTFNFEFSNDFIENKILSKSFQNY